MPTDNNLRRPTDPVEYLPTEREGPKPGVALCLSGGGYRAMVFHVGVVWRLFEARLPAWRNGRTFRTLQDF